MPRQVYLIGAALLLAHSACALLRASPALPRLLLHTPRVSRLPGRPSLSALQPPSPSSLRAFQSPTPSTALLHPQQPTHDNNYDDPAHAAALHTRRFDYYSRMHERCARLQALEAEFLLSFWSADLRCFNIQPSLDAAPRVSVTSTCLAIHAMLQSPERWRKHASWAPHESAIVSLRDVVASLKQTPWSGDAFQTPILVQTLCKLRAIDKDDPAYVEAVNRVLDQRSRLSLHRKQPHSAYLRFHNVRALLAVVENELVPSPILGTNRIGYALERANMVAYDELSRQLAFSLSDDSANFDVIVLAYSLLAYWESSQSLFLGSFARGVVSPTNIKLVKVRYFLYLALSL